MVNISCILKAYILTYLHSYIDIAILRQYRISYRNWKSDIEASL